MADVVAVTGATGFIGSTVVRRLLAQGRTVRALVEPRAPTTNLADLNVERVPLDVLDGGALKRALSGCATLYHLAAIYKTWTPDPTALWRVNVEGTTAVLLAAKEAKVRRVVYTSSIAAIGLVPEGEADETTPFNYFDVADAYMVSKWLSERVALRFVDAGLDVVAVNPSLPFGPGDIGPTPTGRIVVSLLNREVPAVTVGGFNAIDVDDCAEGHLLAETKGKTGERYLLAAHNTTLRDFFDLVGRVSGVPTPHVQAPAHLAAAMALGYELWADHISHREPPATFKSVRYTQRCAFFSNTKAKRDLGLPTRPLETTVRRAVDYFRAAGMVRAR